MAKRDSTLVKLSKADFEDLAIQAQKLVMNISRLIVRRYISLVNEAQAPAKAFNIAIVPTTDAVDIASFTQQLLLSFNKIGKTFHLNRQVVERQLSQGVGADNFYLSNWLTDLEIGQTYVLYEGAAYDPEWTKRCLRQADKIILIKETQTGPGLSEVEKEVLFPQETEYAQTKEIVFLYPEETEQPNRSDTLLAQRAVSRHYNIRKNDPRHLDRLARMITGKGIGLVLSGGGARGLAHIGIYKAFRENNIPIDMVAGTSIGGILAAGVAMEWQMDKFLYVCQTAFLEDKPLADYTLPIVSLLKGKQLANANKKHFQNHYIENTWLNYFCISGNYSTAEMVIHETGPIWKAITATASIPGVLPPVVEGNHLLIDGGIFNNFRVDVMLTKYGG